MAKLPQRGAPDPITNKYEAKLRAATEPSFWTAGENVIHAGSGVHEAMAEQHGRGEGEGQFYLTTHRFIFWYDNPIRGEFLALPKDVVQSVRSDWIVIPKMRALVLKMNRPTPSIGNSQSEVRFYVGKPFAGIVERDWQLSS